MAGALSMSEAQALCRDCLALYPAPRLRCPACGSRRMVNHAELGRLSIAHLDCDAFYASVEKRDRPELKDQPVVVGGRERGVVSAACYVARLYGVRSAMPMFKALAACPHAVVIKPDMAKYVAVGREVRRLMLETTPLVEPLSIDEAFLDLTGTEALHGGPPARTLAALALKVEREQRVTVSIGLSYNKSLAKIASDLDKPRGFAVLGEADAPGFLATQSVGLIWGVGKALRARLEGDGIRLIGDLLAFDEQTLLLRYGAMGRRLHRFARGQDDRRIDPEAPTKSISAETTFNRDLSRLEDLKLELWPLAETVARRMKKANLAGRAVVLKLKTRDFKLISRQRRLPDPTQLAALIFQAGYALLEREADGRAFRLIGVGCDDLVDGALADPPDLVDPARDRAARVERAIDQVREKLGKDAIGKGLGLKKS